MSVSKKKVRVAQAMFLMQYRFILFYFIFFVLFSFIFIYCVLITLLMLQTCRAEYVAGTPFSYSKEMQVGQIGLQRFKFKIGTSQWSKGCNIDVAGHSDLVEVKQTDKVDCLWKVVLRCNLAYNGKLSHMQR